MCWGNRHVWLWGATTASDSMPLSLRCACGRYTRQGANDAQAALAAAEQRAERAEAALASALDALEDLAIHINDGPIGSPSEWRYMGRDAARLVLDKLPTWRATLAATAQEPDHVAD